MGEVHRLALRVAHFEGQPRGLVVPRAVDGDGPRRHRLEHHGVRGAGTAAAAAALHEAREANGLGQHVGDDYYCGVGAGSSCQISRVISGVSDMKDHIWCIRYSESHLGIKEQQPVIFGSVRFDCLLAIHFPNPS